MGNYFRISAILIFFFSALSIISLLLYFQGFDSFARLAFALVAGELLGLLCITLLWRVKGQKEIPNLLISGLWAGCLATLAYDIVRVPIAHSGIPVFKAISYFGTILMGVQTPTPLSEAIGWGYHLSNGVSFGLMYAAVIPNPSPISAIIWGLTLEVVMLFTPYAEVFGYRRDAKFLAITIGSHVIYGLVLWLALRYAMAPNSRLNTKQLALGFIGVPLVLAVMAADFHKRFSNHLPPSPPPYIGPYLYTTWNIPEPDRIVVMWVMRRFVESKAVFHFIPPFDAIRYGQPFDLPEAQIRRHGTQSATEFLLAERGLSADPKLGALARMTHLNEVTPWMLASDLEAGHLTEMLRNQADQECGEVLKPECAEKLFALLDRWYEGR
jgi:hypothetical protein